MECRIDVRGLVGWYSTWEQVVGLDASLALQAARLSVQEKLPMADSIMLATAYAHRAILWTQDADFEGLNDVRYIAKGSPDG